MSLEKMQRQQVKVEKLISIPPRLVLEIVRDVESYPLFMPRVLSTNDVERAENVLEFSLKLGFKQLAGIVRIRAVFNPDSCSVSASVQKGPFKSAFGELQVLPDGHGSLVVLKGEYAATVSFVDTLIRRKVGLLLETVAAAIQARARVLPRADTGT